MRAVVSILEKASDEVARYVESRTLRRIATDFGKLGFALGFAYSLSYPADAWHRLFAFASAFNFFPPKFAFWCLLGFVVLPYLRKRFYGEKNVELVEGIPVDEFVDHIFEFKSFKRDDAETVFAMPRNRYQSLANRLDELGIFVRGANNARELNPNLSRKEVVALITGEASNVSKFDSACGVPSGVELPSPTEGSDEISETPEPLPDAVETGFETRWLTEFKALASR